jgi:hypothetical protein
LCLKHLLRDNCADLDINRELVSRFQTAMPDVIQDRISHALNTAIDTKITPAMILLNRKVEALSTAQATSADSITQKVEEIRKTTRETINSKGLEDCTSMTKMENGIGRILTAQETVRQATMSLPIKLENLSIAQSTSTDLVLRNARQIGRETASVIRMQASEGRAQSLSLHKKLNASIGAIVDSLQDFCTSQSIPSSDMSKSEVERAVRNIVGSIWLLLSSLQLLIREFV